jgi:hypothetical protein
MALLEEPQKIQVTKKSSPCLFVMNEILLENELQKMYVFLMFSWVGKHFPMFWCALIIIFSYGILCYDRIYIVLDMIIV